MAIVGECCGWDRETVLLICWRDHRDLFPHQPEQSRYNRRRGLAQVINLVRQAVLQVLDLAQDMHCIIDSLPVPVLQFYYVPQASVEWKVAGATFGHCCSKKQTIFGYKLHLLITQSGALRDFELAPANLPDLAVGVESLVGQTTLQVLGDKGYLSQSVAADLHAQRQVELVTMPRSNQHAHPSPEFRHLHAHLRQLIETVNSQLALQFHIETNHALGFWGLTARLYTILTAHTLCAWLNHLLGVADVLHIKALAFPKNEHNSQLACLVASNADL